MKSFQSHKNNYQSAESLFRSNHMDQAILCCEQILSKTPDHADTLHLIGEIALKRENYPRAAGYFQRALKKHENNAMDYYALGRAFTKMKKFKSAETAFLKAIQMAPLDIDIVLSLAKLMKRQRRIRAAAACYERAISINPSLSDLYINLGSMQNILGEIEAATFNFQVACEMDPYNMTAKHMLAALLGQTTEAAPKQHVQSLFDSCSSKYEHHIINELECRIPELMLNLLNTTDAANRFFQNALDLGCGTGLGGTIFRDKCKQLSGVDVAPKMVAIARNKNIYDTLYVGNILEMQNLLKGKFDFFIASDVLVYIGNLTPLFQLVKQYAQSDALFIFSTEFLIEKGYKIRTSGRYAHSRSYIELIATHHDFQCQTVNTAPIRKEKGQWIKGQIWILSIS